MPLSGSLIVNSSPHSPKTSNIPPKMKLSELGFRQGPFQRTESEKELKKIDNPRPSHFQGGEVSGEEAHRRHLVERAVGS